MEDGESVQQRDKTRRSTQLLLSHSVRCRRNADASEAVRRSYRTEKLTKRCASKQADQNASAAFSQSTQTKHNASSYISASIPCPKANGRRNLPEASSLAFGLEKCEKIALTDGALDITDDGAVGIVEELDADLCDSTTGAGAADDLGNLAELDWLILRGRVTNNRLAVRSGSRWERQHGRVFSCGKDNVPC